MKTIDQAKRDKQHMAESIAEIIRDFEAVYGEDSVRSIRIERWNGSNNAFGQVSAIHVDVTL